MRWVPPSQVPTIRYPVDKFFGTIFSGGCRTPASASRFSIDFRTSAHIGGALPATPAAPPMRTAMANAVGVARLAPLKPFAIPRRAVFVVRTMTAETRVEKKRVYIVRFEPRQVAIPALPAAVKREPISTSGRVQKIGKFVICERRCVVARERVIDHDSPK